MRNSPAADFEFCAEKVYFVNYRSCESRADFVWHKVANFLENEIQVEVPRSKSDSVERGDNGEGVSHHINQLGGLDAL